MAGREGAFGNVMHGLASICHKVKMAETMQGVALIMRAPFFYLTSTQFNRIRKADPVRFTVDLLTNQIKSKQMEFLLGI